MQTLPRLGINIDHIATLRNVRGEGYPILQEHVHRIQTLTTADSITVHLREDGRHIQQPDVEWLVSNAKLPINLELGLNEAFMDYALHLKPYAVCLVPEKREEKTTEHGLDVIKHFSLLSKWIPKLNAANIQTSLFIDPNQEQLQATLDLKAKAIEIHTGDYCRANPLERQVQKRMIQALAEQASPYLSVHAGHGLNFETAYELAGIQAITEFNIGHFLISYALHNGLTYAINHMHEQLRKGRKHG